MEGKALVTLVWVLALALGVAGSGRGARRGRQRIEAFAVRGSGTGRLDAERAEHRAGEDGRDEEEESLVDMVDILRGVAPANRDYSLGNVLPLMSRPRGTTHWVVSHSEDLKNKWFHRPEKVTFRGVRCTHQPSPWIGDYGQFLIFPRLEGLDKPFTAIKHAYSGVHLLNSTMLNFCSASGCSTVEFSPSHHGGMMRLRYPAGLRDHRRHVGFRVPRDEGKLTVDGVTGLVEGFSTANEGGVVNSTAFKHHFSAEVEFMAADASNEETPARREMLWQVTCEASFCEASVSWQHVQNDKVDEVIIRIGTSFISNDLARLNRQRETGNQGFDAFVREAEADWNKILGRVKVFDDDEPDPYVTAEKKATLYTHLYRSLLFPRDLSELDEHGQRVHFSPLDAAGRVFPGPIMVDSGFWDAYRAVYPMLHLVYPEIAKDIMEGWVNALRENNGRVPQWASPGPRVSMVGTMSDVSMAEAIVNGALSGDQAREAFDSMKLNAFNGSGFSSRGAQLGPYDALGYVPGEVALTLNFKLSDYCIAQAARAMGDETTAERLEARAAQWPLIFDNRTLFFRSRDANGDFQEPFDEYAWQTTYTEGGAWQYRFYVPFDGNRLAQVYEAAHPAEPTDGASRLCQTLEEAMRHSPAFHMPHVIHEALEMAANAFGQYAHNNQPTHHILYMFSHANCSVRGQKWIQHATQTLYGTFGYAGDEDNGEMSSWHLLSAFGLYALTPGSGKYQVGAPPLFQRVVIERETGQPLEISREALPTEPLFPGAPQSYPVARQLRWKGQRLRLDAGPVEIPYSELLAGGALVFAE